eukprot:2046636-Alexandrium_andersonii.AAC.1
MAKHLRIGTKVVSDEWGGTKSAAAASGRKVVGNVNHSRGVRNPVTGYHTNDAESEIAGLK